MALYRHLWAVVIQNMFCSFGVKIRPDHYITAPLIFGVAEARYIYELNNE